MTIREIPRVLTVDCWDTLISEPEDLDRAIEEALVRTLGQYFSANSGDIRAAVLDEAQIFTNQLLRDWSAPSPLVRIDRLIRSLHTSASPPTPEHLLGTALRAIDQTLEKVSLKTVPGADELITLAAAHSLSVILVSNTGWISPAATIQALERLDLYRLLSVSFFSADGYAPKPATEMFEKALEFAGVDRCRVVHIGDQKATDGCGALRAGIDVLILERDAGRYSLVPSEGQRHEPRLVTVSSLPVASSIIFGQHHAEMGCR